MIAQNQIIYSQIKWGAKNILFNYFVFVHASGTTKTKAVKKTFHRYQQTDNLFPMPKGKKANILFVREEKWLENATK